MYIYTIYTCSDFRYCKYLQIVCGFTLDLPRCSSFQAQLVSLHLVFTYSQRGQKTFWFKRTLGEMGLTIIWLELKGMLGWKNGKKSSAFGVPKKDFEGRNAGSSCVSVALCSGYVRGHFFSVFLLFDYFQEFERWQWRSVRLWIWKHLWEEPTSKQNHYCTYNYLLLMGTHHWTIQFWLIDVFSCAQEVCFRGY